MTSISEDSPYAVTIPGAVDAWCRLIDTHGKLGMERVLAPAIGFAENGYRITPRVFLDWNCYQNRLGHPAAARRA